MRLLNRLSFVVRSWPNTLLNRTADPAAELDYSYEQLRDELQKVNRAIAEVATQRKRLEYTAGGCNRPSTSTTARFARRSSSNS